MVIAEEKSEAEEALQAAMPALEAARLALADLDKNDITEIRSFATPPEAVQVSSVASRKRRPKPRKAYLVPC